MLDRQFDDRAELPVLLLLEADIAGIDAIFGERLARRPDDRREAYGRYNGNRRSSGTSHALLVEPVANMRHGRRRLVAIDGDAHQFRTRLRQRRDLRHRGLDVRRVGVGHGLHDDGAPPPTVTAPLPSPMVDGAGFATRSRFGGDGGGEAFFVDHIAFASSSTARSWCGGSHAASRGEVILELPRAWPIVYRRYAAARFLFFWRDGRQGPARAGSFAGGGEQVTGGRPCIMSHRQQIRDLMTKADGFEMLGKCRT